MNSRDRRLGMHRPISRRDFLNGIGIAIGTSLVPACGNGRNTTVDAAQALYPPSLTGLRGAHPGSFEAAHAAVQGRRWSTRRASEHYDLVVVGAGISGLTAAWFYRRDIDPGARVLVLDNHDDFGGHAKRNEFSYAMLPHVCPDLPAEQAAALKSSVRAPLVYTNVLIRNWQSLARLGVQRVYCPGSFFQTVMFTHAVSYGDYRFSRSPDTPVILHLSHVPLAPGQPPADQFRAGRRALLETSFETFERHVRDQLGRILAPGGFDPADDIQGITVNRWPHGYAYSVDPDSGDVAFWPDGWPRDRRPWVAARATVGNIAIAGTDAASNAMTEAAIEEAHRSVHSLKTRP